MLTFLEKVLLYSIFFISLKYFVNITQSTE